MLNITGLNRFFFVRDFHDMRCKYDKVLSIIHQQIHEGYFPFSGQPAIIDVVPGTHASGSFPAYLAFNKYVPDTPLYREMYRLSGESMHLSRMSLTNWLEKGSTYFCGLIAYLRSPLAGCRLCLCLIISRDFSVKLLKDVGIMNICYPWQSDWSNNKY